MLLFNHEPTPTIEKIMSCTRREFELGLLHLTGRDAVHLSDDDYDLSELAGGKSAHCIFEPQPDRVLGHLLRLPQAKVTLHLEVLSVPEREELVQHFDRVFQRGGG